jgi:hypothetical protein
MVSFFNDRDCSFGDKFCIFIENMSFILRRYCDNLNTNNTIGTFSSNYNIGFALHVPCMKYRSPIRFLLQVPMVFLQIFTLHPHVPWNTGILRSVFFAGFSQIYFNLCFTCLKFSSHFFILTCQVLMCI